MKIFTFVTSFGVAVVVATCEENAVVFRFTSPTAPSREQLRAGITGAVPERSSRRCV